jgi:hypothetical protein
VTISRDLTGCKMQSRPRENFWFEQALDYVWHQQSWPLFYRARNSRDGERGERSLAAFHPFVVFEYVSDDVTLG